jgi:23S rRNA (pseudouridine1915-N3)-methyltransferase
VFPNWYVAEQGFLIEDREQWKANVAKDHAKTAGANGVDQKLKDNVDLIISFSKMTFPHMLARVILLEQIYRAEAIIAKHPYHRN